MAEPVQCDICGKLYSSRHLSSHKRLAHAKHGAGSSSEEDEIQTIFKLYKRLSGEHKKRVLAKLTADQQEPS